jgi:integrase
MNKKNFVLNNLTYTIVIGKRNYLEFNVEVCKSGVMLRKRIYKGFSICDDIGILNKIAIRYFELINAGYVLKPKPSSLVHQYLLDHKYRFKPRTFDQFLGITNRLQLWCDKHYIQAHHIDYIKCRQYISEMSATRKNGTIFNITLVLKSIWNGLIKEKIVKENPWANLPKIKRNPTSLMYFSTTQEDAIETHCFEHNIQLYRAIALLYSCGIRPEEMRHLKIYNVNFEDNLIEILGEDAKNGKTQKVYMPEHVKKLLLPLTSYPMHYYLFSRLGNPSDTMLGPNYLNEQHREVLRLLKINGRFAIYSWKHTGAVAMVRAGINIKLIQLQLRHSSLDMTNEYLKNLGITDNDDLKNKMPTL